MTAIAVAVVPIGPELRRAAGPTHPGGRGWTLAQNPDRRCGKPVPAVTFAIASGRGVRWTLAIGPKADRQMAAIVGSFALVTAWGASLLAFEFAHRYFTSRLSGGPSIRTKMT